MKDLARMQASSWCNEKKHSPKAQRFSTSSESDLRQHDTPVSQHFEKPSQENTPSKPRRDFKQDQPPQRTQSVHSDSKSMKKKSSEYSDKNNNLSTTPTNNNNNNNQNNNNNNIKTNNNNTKNIGEEGIKPQKSHDMRSVSQQQKQKGLLRHLNEETTLNFIKKSRTEEDMEDSQDSMHSRCSLGFSVLHSSSELCEEKPAFDISYSTAFTQGDRDHMEDIWMVSMSSGLPPVTPQLKENTKGRTQPPHSVFGLFDGHGGVYVAEFVRQNIYKNIISNWQTTNYSLHPSSITKAIEQGFADTEEQLIEKSQNSKQDAGAVGTTACLLIALNHTVYIANVGDSQAVMFRKSSPAAPLNQMHRLTTQSEYDRVQKEGGAIINIKNQLRLAHPIWNPNIMNLSVTRAFGDLYFKKAEYTKDKNSGLSAVPQVASHTLTDGDWLIVIASDGFWELCTISEVEEYLQNRSHIDINTLAQKLLDFASLKSSRLKIDLENTTILCVKFDPKNSENDSQNKNLEK